MTAECEYGEASGLPDAVKMPDASHRVLHRVLENAHQWSLPLLRRSPGLIAGFNPEAWCHGS
jgi:hypothetical protein